MVELGRDIESRRKRDLLQLQSRLAGTDARGVGVSEAHDAGPRIAVAGAGGVLTHVSAADFAASHAGRRGAGDAAGLAREGEATDVGLPEGVVGSVPESVAAAARAGRDRERHFSKIALSSGTSYSVTPLCLFQKFRYSQPFQK